MSADSNTELNKMLKLADECELHEMVRRWLVGDITPEALATFFLRLRDFKDVSSMIDVCDRVIHFAYLSTPEVSQAEQAWKDKLLAKENQPG